MKSVPFSSPAPAATSSSELVGRMALRFGVAGGLLCAVWMLVLHLTGNNPFGPKQILVQLVVPMLAVAAEWRLRLRLAPEKPGVGRALTLGGMVVLLAALISASSLMGLASGADETKLLALNKAEAREIVLSEQQNLPKEKRDAKLTQQSLQAIDHWKVVDLAERNFTVVLLLGLALAVPGGIFFRE